MDYYHKFWLWKAFDTLHSSSKSKYDIKLYFSSAGESELTIAKQYIKENQGKFSKLVITWHSMGADDAVELAQLMKEEKINVDLLAIIDLQSVWIDSTNISNNVKKSVNYRQYHWMGSLNWDIISWDSGVTNNYLINTYQDMTGIFGYNNTSCFEEDLTHTTIDDMVAPFIVDSIREL